MVTIFNLDVPNLYISGAVGGVFVLFLIWYLFRNKGGRLGEEKLEEGETERLETDERQAEAAQKDEKKECAKMMKLINLINDTLKKEGMGAIYDGILGVSASVRIMLVRMRDEKMNLERAIETFKELHAKLNEFIAKLPKDNKTINGLVGQLIYYQKREYIDLMEELKMDENEKAELKKLWNQVNDKESGSGSAKAA